MELLPFLRNDLVSQLWLQKWGQEPLQLFWLWKPRHWFRGFSPCAGFALPARPLLSHPKGLLGARSCWHLHIFALFFFAQGAMSILLPHLTPTEKPPSSRSPVSPGLCSWQHLGLRASNTEMGLVLTSTGRVGAFWPNHHLISWKISTEMSEDKLTQKTQTWFSSISQSIEVPV